MLFFDPSMVVLAEREAGKPIPAEVQRDPERKAKETNSPLPPPPDKTTAPRKVDPTGAPRPVEKEEEEEEDTSAAEDRDRSDEPRERELPSPSGMSRSPWGDGASHVR